MNGPIAWFARNGVAANLLLLVIIVAGAMTIGSIRKEVFPEFSSDIVTISVPYRGAAPEEVEEGVCVKIEEAIQGVDGIKRIRSTATEGAGTVVVEILPGSNAQKVLDDIKTQVDAIETFPEQTEKAIVQELVIRSQVINVAIAGQADETTIKRLGEQVRDEISSLPGITQVELVVARPYEISIELSEETLRQFGLTFDEVAQAVRRSSLDLPGGSIKSIGGEYSLRVKAQAYRAPDFEKIPLRTRPDGSRLLLGDVARIVDGFEDVDRAARFNGKPAVVVQVFRVGDQNALEISEKIYNYVREAQARMPEGIALTPYSDYSKLLRSRLDLLVRNARMGFVLVFLLLALFLKFRLAFWVSIGIPVSFLGTLWLMPSMDISINLLSLFAFLLVLGIVVDDAIVVSENIYTHQQEGKPGLIAAVEGTREVAVPVIFSVLTTVAAFAPMALVPGNTGKVLKAIPLIVIPTLVFSLVESMFCLPNHLTHLPADKKKNGFHPILRFQQRFARGLESFIGNQYRRFLELCLRWRYVALSVGFVSLLLSVGLIGGGWLKFQFFPPVEGDDIAAFITMPEGTPPEITAAAVKQVNDAIEQLQAELVKKYGEPGRQVILHTLASIGEQPFRTAISKNGGNTGRQFASPNLGEVHVQLAPSETREVGITATELVNRWRQLTGPIPDAREATFTSAMFASGNAIDIQLNGPKVDELRAAAEELKAGLARYTGVIDIADSYRSGKPEVKLAIKPEAEAAGLTLQDLARQVRQGFYGEEAQRIQRGRDDVRVMVRYPAGERRSLGNLESMRVRLPDGTEVPFSTVATASYGRGYANIYRVDRQRSINVTADVDTSKANSNEILASVMQNELPALKQKYPTLRYSFEGERREQMETMDGLIRGFILSLIMIFALIAVPLKSYLHPFVVMSAIPFGFVGAVLGHLIMGMQLTVLSMFGLVALAGVAVNDSLVLVDFINRARREGIPIQEAVRAAGLKRFRPILLTSLTTFAGLVPLILEKSLQAKFLIPMAVSLGFGVLYCTITSLLLVPVQYLILEDFHKVTDKLFRRRSEPAPIPVGAEPDHL